MLRARHGITTRHPSTLIAAAERPFSPPDDDCDSTAASTERLTKMLHREGQRDCKPHEAIDQDCVQRNPLERARLAIYPGAYRRRTEPRHATTA